MPSVLQEEYIQPMSPSEAEMMAYRLSSSSYEYQLKLEEFKANVELWSFQQIQNYLEE